MVKAAVERLQDEDQVRIEEDKIMSRGASRAEGEAYPDDEVHDSSWRRSVKARRWSRSTASGGRSWRPRTTRVPGT